MKKLRCLLLALLVCLALTACGGEKDVMEEIYSAPIVKVESAESGAVLFGQENLQIDGVTYVADPGVPYSRILDWAGLACSYCAENYAD